MNVTKKDISAIFGVPLSAIEQIGAKQLFVVNISNGDIGYRHILVSYRTIIGFHDSEFWYITTRKYSRTTSSQITAFSRNRWDRIKYIPNEELVALLPATLRYYAR